MGIISNLSRLLILPLCFALGTLVGFYVGRHESLSLDPGVLVDGIPQTASGYPNRQTTEMPFTPVLEHADSVQEEARKRLVSQVSDFTHLRETGYIIVPRGLFSFDDSVVNIGILSALGFDRDQIVAVQKVLVEHLSEFDELAARNAKIVSHEKGFSISISPFIEGVAVHDRMVQALNRTLGVELGTALNDAFSTDIEERILNLCSEFTTYDVIVLNDNKYQVSRLYGREFVYSATNPEMIQGQEALRAWAYPFENLLPKQFREQ